MQDFEPMEWEEFDLKIGLSNFRIRKVRDIDSLFDRYLETEGGKGNEELIPYWAELWHSAIALSEYISENSSLVKGKKVYEIGCGLGLPGIVAGSLGAERVHFSDLLPEPLECALTNWQLNLKGEPESSILDFTQSSFPKGFDLILASDIAYEKRLFPALAKRFSEANQYAGILLTEPGRTLSKGLFSRLADLGMIPETSFREIIHKGLKIRAGVYYFARKQGP